MKPLSLAIVVVAASVGCAHATLAPAPPADSDDRTRETYAQRYAPTSFERDGILATTSIPGTPLTIGAAANGPAVVLADGTRVVDGADLRPVVNAVPTLQAIEAEAAARDDQLLWSAVTGGGVLLAAAIGQVAVTTGKGALGAVYTLVAAAATIGTGVVSASAKTRGDDASDAAIRSFADARGDQHRAVDEAPAEPPPAVAHKDNSDVVVLGGAASVGVAMLGHGGGGEGVTVPTPDGTTLFFPAAAPQFEEDAFVDVEGRAKLHDFSLRLRQLVRLPMLRGEQEPAGTIDASDTLLDARFAHSFAINDAFALIPGGDVALLAPVSSNSLTYKSLGGVAARGDVRVVVNAIHLTAIAGLQASWHPLSYGPPDGLFVGRPGVGPDLCPIGAINDIFRYACTSSTDARTALDVGLEWDVFGRRNFVVAIGVAGDHVFLPPRTQPPGAQQAFSQQSISETQASAFHVRWTPVDHLVVAGGVTHAQPMWGTGDDGGQYPCIPFVPGAANPLRVVLVVGAEI